MDSVQTVAGYSSLSDIVSLSRLHSQILANQQSRLQRTFLHAACFIRGLLSVLYIVLIYHAEGLKLGHERVSPLFVKGYLTRLDAVLLIS